MGLFRRKDVGKIYTTTDGYFADNPRNKKKTPRCGRRPTKK